jgi:hypothetical protein
MLLTIGSLVRCRASLPANSRRRSSSAASTAAFPAGHYRTRAATALRLA